MRRWRVIVVAVLLALIGTTVPLAATLYMSWQMALAAQREQLGHAAELALARAGSIYADAATTLRSIAATDFEHCSPAHIALMRQFAIASLATRNIGYVNSGVLECDIWGITQQRIPREDDGRLQPDGLSLTVNDRPRYSEQRPSMVLRFGGYEVVVDQLRFFPSPSLQLAVIEIRAPGDIRLVTEDPGPEGTPIVAAEMRATPGEAPLASAARTARGWTVIAREPRLSLGEHMRNAQLLLLPLALFLAGLFAGLAIWLSRRRLSPRGELALAVRNREFLAHYQPIIELATGRCIGAEALVRWRRPDGSLVRPDLFIPLAEETGFIGPITDHVVERVVDDLGDLLRRDRRLHIAINLGAADISSGRILPVLEAALADTGIEPQQIWLEATERGFVDIEGARHTLAALRRRGHMTAIDDFGTGYSGLKYLQRLPVDALKIDKSFIDAVGTEAPTSHVTEHIIAMARELKLRIVAEGVETEAQAAYLRQRGVGFAQGWLFSRALPPEEFAAFCTRNRKTFGVPANVETLAAE
ncbi:EAL domain protein [Ancylobacter novellus DSM 506]|uniref:cyclic-guanylate-specific phosphodiesterase n=1 Tax=Ancylobacter novellus (strain ATCC 8093 / DSM 506 / JCM 20403 / CCM 1077 / IAM 12100 / NBRC 12443 / NCIMB 10456) TaxID=639283 RepID=D6ZZ18_ANCN5|nr:EAL domain-containing protein [Ancylobacter novellus]ADH91137.1 EAL domain protein [Ancylobacter novellus DSM 506]